MKLMTQRLILLPVKLENFEMVKKIFTNSYVRCTLFDNKILSDSEILEFINISLQTFLQHHYGLWLISTCEFREIIGVAGLWRFFDEEQPQLIYALLPAHTHHGYATEASLKIVEYAFTSLSYAYVDVSCDVGNEASHKVALRIGMKCLKQETVNGLKLTFYRLIR